MNTRLISRCNAIKYVNEERYDKVARDLADELIYKLWTKYNIKVELVDDD